MSVVNDASTFGRTRLSFANEAEIDDFVATLERYETGQLTPDQWRAYRLVRGTYGQRQAYDAQMLRVKVPQGIITAAQLQAFADVGERYSRGFGHITTRQNIQFHFVKLHDVEAAMRRLAEDGLTTREACGNSVRNIVACPYAGVAEDELFDVTPYAEALTRYLLRHPLTSVLPRKFKIAFEGCDVDHVITGIHDVGVRARVRQNGHGTERGFRVTVAGGTAILCRSGSVLFEFLPADQLFGAVEAVIRVFHQFGDFKHKQHNRLKFLVKEMGWERWHEEFERAFTEFQAGGGAPLPFDPQNPPEEERVQPHREPPTPLDIARRASSSKVSGPGIVPDVKPVFPMLDHDFAHWLETNVKPQRQAEYTMAIATVTLGDLTSEQMRILADLSLAYSDGTVRVTPEQDLVLRWVERSELQELYRRLAAAGLGLPDATTVANVTSCPGAESCRLAVTQSRGLGRELGDHLRTRPELVAAAADLRIKISGCPNGCGQHHIAGLGFQGSVRKVGGKALPQYFVMVGGGADDQGATFGRLAAKIPARRLTETLERLIELYRSEAKETETATAFFQRVDVQRVRLALADLETVSLDETSPEDFVDLGEEGEFSPEVLDGECSA